MCFCFEYLKLVQTIAFQYEWWEKRLSVER